MLGIDIGSNTLRAVLMDKKLNKKAEFEFIITAAKNLDYDGKIGEEAVEKLKNALTILSKHYKLSSAIALATAAFRKASNTKEILNSLYNEFGITIQVIDAQTEAQLSVLGMQTALNRLGIYGDFAFCDLGGASCEFSFANHYTSYDFGIVRFYEKIKTQIKNTQANTKLKKNKKYIACIKRLKDKKTKLHFLLNDTRLKIIALQAFEEVKNLKKALQASKKKYIVLNSGVPTTLCALKLGLNYENYEAKKINGMRLNTRDFLYYGVQLWNMSEKEAQYIVGKTRKNYLVAGCFLLFALFENHKLIVVDEGLREGICKAAIEKKQINTFLFET
ncbi:Ppx/GppA family phosphatase [Campylobacter sp. MIT 21-1685]|uniref:Ppx/GppA phosphatase family protein n=1 Tax=unclassified Campylobacter TaxID=2593542 RepID=UPI00224B70C6|nr:MULTISPECIES: Ppx/GppA family phosphatase [unclassified Campylobacter]MCX2682487.1 Ppx/GppA family phosphatase [Campylobacter sp. MIT 21-1684]MCX2750800.1 Ppx/GppA family phosphatase [Campylobacter sp. MIT 21-1682]MCX2806968.1 Ppx/GppA family phosphatase [Campylobacter sp. MIT 21-1685]